jgi:uncharacterized protein YndB with AHSA1/START domain
MSVLPRALYLAWTEQFDQWFAAPGSVWMRPEVNVPFFFETDFDSERHPHYGRFLRLERDRVVEMTWVTSATLGIETVVRVELAPRGGDTVVKLSHSGFPDEVSLRRHEQAWPMVLEQLEKRLSVHS